MSLTLKPGIRLHQPQFPTTPPASLYWLDPDTGIGWTYQSGTGTWTPIIPSLDLNFAGTKSLRDGISGRDLVTFTRASSGTYVDSAGVLRTAANDEPRFDHNPTTGESLGLLVEEARTNLLTYTEQLDNPTWDVIRILPFGSGSIANAAIAPDGTLTADKLVEDTSASTTHYFSQNFAAAATTNYTFSIFLKAAERSWVVFLTGGTTFGSHGVYVDLVNGITGTVVGTPISTKVDKYSNGWVRVSITQVSTVLGTGVLQVRTATGNGGQVYTGDGTSGVYAWGAQVEAGAFPTSYIPTTDSAATRAADVASITGSAFSSWYRQDEGTVFVAINRDTGIAINSRAVSVTDGTLNNRAFDFRQDTSSQGYAFSVTSGSTDLLLPFSLTPGSRSNAIAIAQSLNNAAVTSNGSIAQTDTSVLMPVVNRLNIGNLNDGGQFGGTIRRLTYWPARLPNATLQALTL